MSDITPNGLVHPAAELFPMLSTEELAELAADIVQNGLHHPIVLLPDGTLLDGRNRLAACDMVEVEPSFTTYTGDDPIGYVVSANIHRRHLGAGQKAALANELLPHYEQQAKERQGARTDLMADLPQSSEGLAGVADFEADLPQSTRAPQSRDLAAKAVGVSGRAVAQYKRIVESDAELAEKVKAGTPKVQPRWPVGP